MISSFGFKAPPQILFGPGKFTQIGKLISRFGLRPLLVFGSSSFCNTESYQLLQKDFDRLNISAKEAHIGSEPSPEMIDKIVAEHLHSNRDMVIAFGGGSVLDGGKALSAMLVEKGTIVRFLEGVGTESPSGRKLPFIAIPTTSGTGSEATSNAVISLVGENGFKKSLRHDNYVPNLALVDPSLTLSCPTELTVACSMDCFTQLVEGYLSTNGSILTDTLALNGIEAVHRSLRPVCADGNNLTARTDLSYGSLLSGIVLANAGLGTVHGFASAIGGFFAIPHGVICGTLMAVANKFTLKNLQNSMTNQVALQKYSTLGKLCSNAANKSNSWYQQFFIEELEQLTSELHIPMLDKFGVTLSDIDKIVVNTSNKYNPAQLTQEELRELLHNRIE